MSRQKIDYGIDLGTTNSAIARMDNGQLKIYQIEPYKKNIMPSCVHFTKSQMFVGDLAYNKLFDTKNTFEEFKRTMGDHTQYFSNKLNRSFSSEELSAEVLKALKSAVKDEEFSSAVITVPADFDQVQIEATRRAAELAGFEYCELLQEPIAASLAYLSEKNNIEGTWLVFDLGGGTFDVALVRMEDGIMKIIDHAGDNHLGGKDMDELIVDEIIIPYLQENSIAEKTFDDKDLLKTLRKRLKRYAEQAKIALSDQESTIIDFGEPVFKYEHGIDEDTMITIERSEFEDLITPLIKRALSLTNELIANNKQSFSDLMTVLIIGGPTYIPFLRESIKNEICKDINVTINPMTAVAQGAAIFASTRPIPIGSQRRDLSKFQLTLTYPDTTAETEVLLGIKVEYEKMTNLVVPSKIYAEITRRDLAWTTGKIELQEGAGVARVNLIDNTTNIFQIQLYNETGSRLDCEPNEISILQGVKIANPPLPHDIGVSVNRSSDNEEIMVAILNKGSSLPATGEKKNFTCPKNLRPGNDSDVLKIIIWQGKENTIARRNRRMGVLEISGAKLPSLLPAGSKVEITIKLDESRRGNVKAFLPYLDETFEWPMDMDYKRSAMSQDELFHQIDDEKNRSFEIQNKIMELEIGDKNEIDSIKGALDELEDLNEKGRGYDDSSRSTEVQDRLNELAVKMDDIQNNIEWPQVENELKEELEIAVQAVERYGDESTEKYLNQIKTQVSNVIRSKNTKRANDVIDKLNTLKWDILFKQPGYWISALNNINDAFDEIQWIESSKARSLIDKGSEILASGQYSNEIREIVMELWELMPESDKEKTKEPRTDILHY